MKKYLIFFVLLFSGCLPAPAQSVNTRINMGDTIIANIYQNSTHAITGTVLQGVMLQQNDSYLNMKTDTGFIGYFSPLFVYWPGMSIIHGSDSVYTAKVYSNGAFSLSNWKFKFAISNGATGTIGGSVKATQIPFGSGTNTITGSSNNVYTTNPVTGTDSCQASNQGNILDLQQAISGNSGISLSTSGGHNYITFDRLLKEAYLTDSANDRLNLLNGEIQIRNKGTQVLDAKGDSIIISGTGGTIITGSEAPTVYCSNNIFSLRSNTGKYTELVTKIAPSGNILDTLPGISGTLALVSQITGGVDTGTHKSSLSVYQAGLIYLPKIDSGNTGGTINGHYYTPYRLLHDTNNYLLSWNRFLSSIRAGTNITLSTSGTAITINSSGGGGSDSGIARGWGIKVTTAKPRVISVDTTVGNANGARPSTQYAALKIVQSNAWLLSGNTFTTRTNILGILDTVPLGIYDRDTLSGWIDYQSSYANSAWGYGALKRFTLGHFNTATGYWSEFYTTTGSSNTASGYKALSLNTTGSSNTVLGANALSKSNSDRNTAVGDSALFNVSTGVNNTATGYKALSTIGSASGCSSYGNYALFANVADNNTAVGDSALATNTTGTACTALGSYALQKSTGSNNTATGFNALANITSPGSNTAFGNSALGNSTTGSDNTAVGYEALLRNGTGKNNVGIGYLCQSSGSNNNASSNTISGAYSGFSNAGDANTDIGDSAGYTNTTGTNNTFIGYQAIGSSATVINATALGNGASAASNTVRLGNSSITTVGIGAGAYTVPIQDAAPTGTGPTVASNGSQIIALTPGTIVGTLTITAPNSPVNGQLWEVTTGAAIASLTINAGTGSATFATPVTAAALTVATPVRYIYDALDNEWYNQ